MGLIGKLFCLLIVLVGLSEVIGYAPAAFNGFQLARSGETVEVQIIDKQIERNGPRRKPTVESVSVNGNKVRGLRTYFNQYVLIVAIDGPGGSTTAKAPVSYDRWHQEQVGQVITANLTPDVPDYVDADSIGTLLYALHNMALGLLVVGVGVVAMRLKDDHET